MRLRAILAGVLVAMLLSGAGFGPVCKAACTEAAQVLSCSGHGMQSAGMQSGDAGAAQMAEMRNCAACGSRGSILITLADPCGHDSIAEIRTLDGHEGSASLRISQSELGGASTVLAQLAVARSSLSEPPGSRTASPISLHTTLRV